MRKFILLIIMLLPLGSLSYAAQVALNDTSLEQVQTDDGTRSSGGTGPSEGKGGGGPIK